MRSPPSDVQVRQQALDPRQSFLVQAPAGSGKTELLTDRILALLATVDEPEEIVAITFTTKAAAEMHSRVLDKLRHPQHFSPQTQELAAQVRQRADRLDWQLLQQPQRLRIQTIDSLASHIAHQLPAQAGLGSRFAMADDAAQLYRAAARRLLDDLEQQCPHRNALSQLLEHLDNDLQAAEALLISMLERRDQWLPLLPAGHSDWDAVRAELEAALREVVGREFAQACVHMSAATLDQLHEIGLYAASQLEAEGRAHKLGALQQLGQAPEPLLQHLAAWQSLLYLLLTDDGSWRRSFNKTMGLPAAEREGKAYAAQLKEIVDGLRDDDAALRGLNVLRDLPQPAYSDDQWAVLQALFSVLKVAAAYLWLTFQERGAVDFIEVAGRALLALGSEDEPSDILLALDHKLQHLLVDEFQDTSLAQIRLLTRLTSGWQAGDGRTLFVVGDPMQSIYRFRKAEVSLFLEAGQRGVGSVALQAVHLTDNFRSCRDIVDWVNATFSRVMPERDNVLAGAIHYSPATAYHREDSPEEHPAIRLHGHWPGTGMSTSIVQAVREGLELSADSTVAILGRTRRQLEFSMQVLREAGIAYRAVELQPLRQQLWIQDLLQLTRALLQPADRLAWLSVLRAPWCGLTLVDLDLLAGEHLQAPVLTLLRERLPRLSADGQQRASRVLHVLDTHWQARERQPLVQQVSSAWQALGGPQTLPHAAAHADCARYLDWLEQQAWPIDLDRLESGLDRLFAAPDPRPQAQRVVLMTMHKSKGLQFDCVLLPALDARANRDGSRLLLIEEAGQHLLFAPMRRRDGRDDDRLYRWLAGKEEARAWHEAARLLYVAATRAKRQLHLLATLKADESGQPAPPPRESLLAQLWPVIAEALRPQQEAPPLAVSEAATAELPPQPLLRLPLAQLPPVSLQAAASSGGKRATYLPPQTATAIGTVVHAWLEQIGREGAEHWLQRDLQALQSAMQLQLRQLGVAGADLRPAVSRVQQALQQTLADPRGRWLLSGQHPEHYSEWTWLTQDAQGHLQRLIMDRCFRDEQGQFWLVDFKTSAPASTTPLADFLHSESERYREQLQTYADLLAAYQPRIGLYFPMIPCWHELPALPAPRLPQQALLDF